MAESTKGNSPHVKLARAAIDAWVKNRRIIDPEEMGELLKDLPHRPPSARTGGRRRAATRDPRFPPVSPDELEELEISVDVLGNPEAVDDISQLDPRRYGVIVQRGGRIGLLLPDLEGVDTVEEQLDIARRKAGIGQHEPIQIYRFTVARYH